MKLTGLRKDKRTEVEKSIDEELSKILEDVQSRENPTGFENDEQEKKLREHKKQKMSDLDTLLELIEKRKKLDEGRTQRISPDTIAIIVGNLLGIALILGYERLNVISSKALGFVLRGRV